MSNPSNEPMTAVTLTYGDYERCECHMPAPLAVLVFPDVGSGFRVVIRPGDTVTVSDATEFTVEETPV